MNKITMIRDRIRTLIIEHEMMAQRLWRGILTFVSLLVINRYFGYLSILNHSWVALLIALGVAFIPTSGAGLVLAIYLVIHLANLATDVAMILLLLFLLGYFLCYFYQSKEDYNMILLPVFTQLGIPFVIPMESGLMGGLSEVCSIICGGTISFYLQEIRNNASSFLEEGNDISAADVLLHQVLGNRLFYYYMVALIVMFLVISLVRYRKVPYAWMAAVLLGTVSEVVIMLAGYLVTSVPSKVPALLIGSALVLAFGFILNFFFRNLDYTRVEHVQFEDDEYYYYVTAVPKVHLAAEDKKVVKITDEKPSRKGSNE
ncbi:MAG: hypothetical protein II169_07690 [Lachnospiraceae bacterium]|nr:hypothetical protein [Lachnospiraceae bacterium]